MLWKITLSNPFQALENQLPYRGLRLRVTFCSYHKYFLLNLDICFKFWPGVCFHLMSEIASEALSETFIYQSAWRGPVLSTGPLRPHIEGVLADLHFSYFQATAMFGSHFILISHRSTLNMAAWSIQPTFGGILGTGVGIRFPSYMNIYTCF